MKIYPTSLSSGSLFRFTETGAIYQLTDIEDCSDYYVLHYKSATGSGGVASVFKYDQVFLVTSVNFSAWTGKK